MSAAAEAQAVRARMIDHTVTQRINAWAHICGPVNTELQEQFTTEATHAWDAEFPQLAATAHTNQQVAS